MARAQPSSSTDRTNGLATYLKVVYSPRLAFAQLAQSPTWIAAAFVSVVLMAFVFWLLAPSIVHDTIASGRPSALKLPLPMHSVFILFAVSAVLLIGRWLFWAFVFHVGAKIAGGVARFGLTWTVAVNLSLVYCVVALAWAAFVATTDPHQAAGPHTFPSVENLVHAPGWLGRFLAYFGPITLWYWLVAVIGLEQALKMRRWPAIATVLAGTCCTPFGAAGRSESAPALKSAGLQSR